MSTTLNSAGISQQRKHLLSKLEAFAGEFFAELQRRGIKDPEFYRFLDVLSPAVFDLVCWEQIHSHDLRATPNLKRLFFMMTRAARHSVDTNGARYPEFAEGRRSFHEVREVELACYTLPRLERILHCWGMEIDDHCGATFAEHPLSDEAADALTDYPTSS
jgi:hypothetical protein